MKILYKDDEQNLAVAQVTKAIYELDEEALQVSTPEEDFQLEMKKAEAEEIIRALYTEDKADATAFTYRDMVDEEFDEDNDDYYDDVNDLEEEEDDFIDRMIELDMGIDGVKFE